MKRGGDSGKLAGAAMGRRRRCRRCRRRGREERRAQSPRQAVDG